MRIILVAAAIALPVSAYAEGEWIKVAETPDMIWEYQTGSGSITTNRSNKQIVVALGRTFNRKTGSYDFHKQYVSLDDCAAKAGKLVTVNLQGDFRYDNDFVSNGGNIASTLAQILCSVAEKQRQEDDAKGI